MAEILLLRTAIFFSFYIIGAYATTDILRLLKGSTSPVGSSVCYCPVCGCRIALKDQIPIISYILGKGECRSCHSRIPASDLFLEIFLFAALSIIAAATSFSWYGFVFCIAFYELVKAAFILINGAREKDFLRNLFVSLLNNIGIFAITGILFFINYIV